MYYTISNFICQVWIAGMLCINPTNQQSNIISQTPKNPLVYLTYGDSHSKRYCRPPDLTSTTRPILKSISPNAMRCHHRMHLDLAIGVRTQKYWWLYKRGMALGGYGVWFRFLGWGYGWVGYDIRWGMANWKNLARFK
jgi:hypothetical protein